MALLGGQELRKRNNSVSIYDHSAMDGPKQLGAATAELEHPREEVVWGKTPSGQGEPIFNLRSPYSGLIADKHGFQSAVFRVPTTFDVLTTLFHPAHHKSHLDIVNLSLLGLQLLLFYQLPRPVSKWFFLFYFVFWRTAYNAGLGCILTKQSKKRWIVREIQRLGWLDEDRRPVVRRWIRAQLAGKMGKDYSFDVSAVHVPTFAFYRICLFSRTCL